MIVDFHCTITCPRNLATGMSGFTVLVRGEWRRGRFILRALSDVVNRQIALTADQLRQVYDHARRHCRPPVAGPSIRGSVQGHSGGPMRQRGQAG